jgi:hypothetical protein
MATIIAESKWPSESNKKLAEVWLGMDAPPDYMKMIWAGTVSDIALGEKGLVLWQCEDSKIAEGLIFIKTDIARYNLVPGYSCQVNVWTEPEDALKIIGMG